MSRYWTFYTGCHRQSIRALADRSTPRQIRGGSESKLRIPFGMEDQTRVLIDHSVFTSLFPISASSSPNPFVPFSSRHPLPSPIYPSNLRTITLSSASRSHPPTLAPQAPSLPIYKAPLTTASPGHTVLRPPYSGHTKTPSSQPPKTSCQTLSTRSSKRRPLKVTLPRAPHRQGSSTQPHPSTLLPSPPSPPTVSHSGTPSSSAHP